MTRAMYGVALAALAGCGQTATELVVRVRSDIPAVRDGGSLRAVTIRVSRVDGSAPVDSFTAPLTGRDPVCGGAVCTLPADRTFYAVGGDVAAYRVEVTGVIDRRTPLVRTFVVTPRAESRAVLEVWLAARCLTAPDCAEGSTCGLRACEPVMSPTLMAYTPLDGGVARTDATTPDDVGVDAVAIDRVAPPDAGSDVVPVGDVVTPDASACGHAHASCCAGQCERGSVCAGGRCCVTTQGLCQDSSWCCADTTCRDGRCCTDVGGDCITASDCCADMTCTAGRCAMRPAGCGTGRRACCAGDCASSFVCTVGDAGVDAGVCAVCGDIDQVCCPGLGCYDGMPCTAGRCRLPTPCGARGQPCCRGQVCNGGAYCTTAGTCGDLR